MSSSAKRFGSACCGLMVRRGYGVLFGVMLLLGFSRPHAAAPQPRTLNVAFTCSWSPDSDQQCLASAESAIDARG
jgi:hypothetical protein